MARHHATGEEMLRDPVLAPQACVADAALVGWISPKPFELEIRQRLAGDADEQDQRAEDVLPSQRIIGESRRNKNRESQRDRTERLVLQEEEHAPRRVEAPRFGKGRIAGIVRDAAVRTAMCRPSRSDQIATNAATSPCRAFGLTPAIGHSALPAPTSPTAKVQIVSTQPELPVRCCTRKANAIRTHSDSAMASSAQRYTVVIWKPRLSRIHVFDQ